MPVTSEQIKSAARGCGFELAGIAAALPHEDFGRFERWRAAGRAGEMGYLMDRRGDLRGDPRSLLPEARSIICVGKLYNAPQEHTRHEAALLSQPKSQHHEAALLSQPKSQHREAALLSQPKTHDDGPSKGWISRYAWGSDYHDSMREGLSMLVRRIELLHGEPIASRVCVDTAPLLERSYARAAGLGWIGKNTCLINQQQGSWFFLGELLVSIELALDAPPSDRCGTCRRCIDACPTSAIVPDGPGWTLDARTCISYLTIEKRGAFSPEEMQATGNHVFGCDICQDVCPWNHRAAITGDRRFWPRPLPDELEDLASLNAEDFRKLFRSSPVWRTKYGGFLRNVAAAMGNSGNPRMAAPLQKLVHHPIETVAAAAKMALAALEGIVCGPRG